MNDPLEQIIKAGRGALAQTTFPPDVRAKVQAFMEGTVELMRGLALDPAHPMSEDTFLKAAYDFLATLPPENRDLFESFFFPAAKLFKGLGLIASDDTGGQESS